MPQKNPQALEFLLSRRSRPAKTLTGPGPDRDTLMTLLTAAARSPDHGKLEPWRFIVLGDAALTRLAAQVRARGGEMCLDQDKIDKAATEFERSVSAVVVVSSPVASEKIPRIEQVYSAGAVCLALLNAALAAGWGANWLSGWASHDRAFVTGALGLTEAESVAGIIHLGTETAPPPERPRPDIEAITEWVAQ